MGNHHDNLDLWDSKYHEWNSVNVGPHKNILDKKTLDEYIQLFVDFKLKVHEAKSYNFV